jgi:hypothetical protein
MIAQEKIEKKTRIKSTTWAKRPDSRTIRKMLNLKGLAKRKMQGINQYIVSYP